MLSSQEFTAAILKAEDSANDGQQIVSAGAALGDFETLVSTVHSCADRSQTPPAPRIPSLATLLSAADQAYQPDQSTAQHNASYHIDSSPTSSIDSNLTPNASSEHRAKPIPIVCTPKDPNRVVTPLSGRGDRKRSDYFTLTRTPSPRGRHFSTSSQQIQDDRDLDSVRHRRRSSSSHISRSLFVLKMHPDQLGNTRYTPTSPLSPRLPSAGRPVSPQPSRARNAASRRQPSRNMQLNLGRYHPSNYQSNSQLAMEPRTSTSQSSGLSYQRMPQTETPRLMRERQRELIDRARMSSKIAASSMGIKPDRPTLAPLGSPTGAVTPLELEEQDDYFQVGGAERISPAQSPGSISNECSKEFGEAIAQKTSKSDGFR